jgi:hypothetical protein
MFVSNSFVVSPVFTTRDANLIDMLRSQHAMAERSREQAEPFFKEEGLVNEVMAGLLVDPAFPEIAFVTPASWIFHTLNFSTVCSFSIVCTSTLRAFSSSFVREILLLYARCLQLSACFQDDHDCSMLLERLDNGFRQAVAFEDPKRLLLKGYSTDVHHLDHSKTIGYFEHFRAEFDKVTLHNLICEDSEALCTLATHQEGFYFNGLPRFVENKSSDKIVRQLRERAFRQEFLRFISILGAPVYTTHDVAQYHKMTKFIVGELEIANGLRDRLQKLSDKGSYRLPFITSKEYAKSILQNIIVATTNSQQQQQQASSSSTSAPIKEETVVEKEEEQNDAHKDKDEEIEEKERRDEKQPESSPPVSPEETRGGCSIM